MRFETYEEAEQWVLARKSLLVYYEPFAAALQEVQDPQNGLLCIHVGGTNGKGSTCRFLHDILRVKYHRVGLYTSPHLRNIRDRIRINGEWIPEEDFLRLLNENIEVIEKYRLGMVGICTLFAFLWFKEQNTDINVIEVSMGGRYDTTNVIKNPLVSVITTIGFDHTEFLGSTIEEIAAEKAGIIKPGCPVLIGRMPDEAKAVIAAEAEKQGSRLIPLPEYENLEQGRFAVKEDTYEIPSWAPYLKHNAVLALSAAEEAGIDIHRTNVKQAMRNSRWPGRFEIVSKHPLVILDGAHNPDGVKALIYASGHLHRPLIAVFSALRDKEGPEMREMLEEACDQVITTEFRHERADHGSHLGGDTVIPDWQRAVEAARQAAGREGTVLITGSLYFISEVRDILLHEEEEEAGK